MAKEKDNKSGSRVLQLVKSIQSNIDSLYKNTYISNNNPKELNILKQNIDNSIDSIINNNIEAVGVPNISQLYNRIQQKGNESSKVTDEIEDIFNDKSITDRLLFSLNENKYLKEYDEEIDLLCKYFPKLEDALEIKKDNVLSADNFTKDFLNILNNSNVKDETAFYDRINHLKKTYKLVEKCEEYYDLTARYGDQFIYIVSYEKAFNRIMNARENLNESFINENFSYVNENNNFGGNTSQLNDGSINLELNISGVLESAINNYKNTTSIIEKTTSFDRTIDNDLEFESLDSTEGLIDTKKVKNSRTKIKTPGCIVKRLIRENTIPIMIEDMCLGYYYLECDMKELSKNSFDLNNLKNNKTFNDINHNDAILKSISSKLSQFIDSKFINANQDLKKEIYMILKHNELFNSGHSMNMKVTFLPAEDVVHMYFKKDKDTNRGISDLDRSILPAKLYTSLYMNNTLGVLTRSQDKRVYYVKQNVDTNISKVLLNTINQIKKSNYGTRELTSAKNLYNLQGSFNDFIIPVGPTGDSPINFEIMQGQNIETKTDLLELLEEMAISTTDVPYELVQSRHQVDYAVRLTTTNSNFLMKTFKRQAKVEVLFSQIVSKIYNAEYGENDTLEVILPPPAYLNIINTNQMLQNVNELTEQIVQMEMGDEDDERLKAIYAKKLKHHYLSTYLDMKAINNLKDQAEIEMKQKINEEE